MAQPGNSSLSTVRLLQRVQCIPEQTSVSDLVRCFINLQSPKHLRYPSSTDTKMAGKRGPFLEPACIE